MSNIISNEEFDPNMSCDEFLEHFGILGMKWGKTKGQKDAIKTQKADKKWEKSITGKKNTIAFEFTNKVLSKLDDNPDYDKELSSVGAKLEKQGKTGRDLDNAYQKQMIPITNKHLLKTDMAHNPSKTKVLQVKEKEMDGDIYMIPYLKTIDDRETKHSEDLFDEEYLSHFGILGMKWGKRKGNSAKNIARADRKWEKGLKTTANKVLRDIGKNGDYKKETEAARTKLKSEGRHGPGLVVRTQTAVIPIANKYLKKSSEAYNPSKTKVIQMRQVPTHGGWELRPHLVRVKDDKEVDHSSDLFDEESLSHFGILGMKWGKRKGSSSSTAKTSSKATKEDMKSKDFKDAKKLKKKKPSELTNNELATLTKRMQLEKSYASLAKDDINPGAKFVRDTVMGVVKQSAAAYIAANLGTGAVAVVRAATSAGSTGAGRGVQLDPNRRRRF